MSRLEPPSTNIDHPNLIHLDEPAFFQDPYPYYARLRASGKPFWLPRAQEEGLWLFSRHADSEVLFKEIAALSKNIRAVRPPDKVTLFDLHVLHRDGEDHLRLRRLVADFFSSRHIAKFETRIERVAQSLVRELKAKGSFDLMADFSDQLPQQVIADLMGIPAEDMLRVREWSIALGDGFDSLLASSEVDARQKQALSAFLEYAREVIANKRRQPDTSLIGHMVAAEAGKTISPDELIAMAGFLLFSGHETTINLIGNSLWLLLSHPSQWQLLKQDPGRIPQAIEEILRYESPEQRTSFRIALEPLEVNGIHIEVGQQIGIILGSANRDEAVFDNPDVFDIQRDARRHLAFGLGLHNCLGKTLARTEARIALGTLIEQLPNLKLFNTQVQWRHNSFFRGLVALPASVSGE